MYATHSKSTPEIPTKLEIFSEPILRTLSQDKIDAAGSLCASAAAYSLNGTRLRFLFSGKLLGKFGQVNSPKDEASAHPALSRRLA
jgi:hypothetical protein